MKQGVKIEVKVSDNEVFNGASEVITPLEIMKKIKSSNKEQSTKWIMAEVI